MAPKIPPHGTENRYTNHGCRCNPCRNDARLMRAKRKRRAVQARWGGPPALVDAQPVRDHVLALRQAGLSRAQITKLANVGEGIIRHLLYGTHDLPPAQQMLWSNAQAVLAVPVPAEVAMRGACLDGSGTRRRLQALMALGWTTQDIAERIGCVRAHVSVLSKAENVTAYVEAGVRRAYDELGMKVPADSVPTQRAKALARRKGWLPPLAWDDDLIDLPDDVLRAELRRRAGLMDMVELQRAHNSRYKHGDITPLTLEASKEYKRRQKADRRDLEVAS